MAAMRESASRLFDLVEFSPPGFFDDVFAFWLLGSQQSSAFDSAISAVQAAARLDLAALSATAARFTSECRPADAAEACVVRHAAFRFFFGRLFAAVPALLSVGEQRAARVLQGCETLRWATPRAMAIPRALMQPEMMGMRFGAIVAKSPRLEEAVQLLADLQFLVNPFDIMADIFRAIKLGEEFVRQNRLANRFGGFVSMFENQKVAGVGEQLAFDEFFPLFCLMFAVAAPSNATAIVAFLEGIAGMPIQPAFICARMFFASAVAYVEEMKVSELELEPINEDEDPLGLLQRSENEGRL